MSKTGIVFSGGGGKGGYEIGVWKALREFNFDQDISAVSGTSVGGLNAALFVQGDYEVAEQLWLNIKPNQVLKLDTEEVVKKILSGVVSLAIPGMQGKIALQLASSFSGNGLITQDGLQEMIENSNVDQSLPTSSIPLYVCALKVPQGELTYTDLTQEPSAKITQWLKATSAIPVIFPNVDIDEQSYCDGGVLPSGFQDNTPYQPLIDHHGCTHIINIYLDRNPDTRTAQLNNPSVKFWNLIPSEKFHGIVDSLNFTAENAQQLIECGYQDTIKILEQFSEFLKTEERYLDAIIELSNSAENFNDQIAINKKFRETDNSALIPASEQSQVLVEYETAELPNDFDQIMTQLSKDLDKQEQQIIAQNTDQLIEDMTENSEELLEEAFASISTLASTEGRINSQFEQGIWGRLFGGITGSNAQQQASINWDLNRSIYATQQLVQKLNHKHMLSMEMMAALSQKTDYMMTHINVLHGKSMQQNQQQMQGLLMMKKGLQILADATDQRFNKLEDRIDNIEKKLAIDDWYHQGRGQYSNLTPADGLLAATADFYQLTDGNWDSASINRYQTLLDDLNLSVQEIAWAECLAEPVLTPFVDRLNTDEIFPIAPKRRNFHSLLTQMQSSYEKTDIALTTTEQTMFINAKELGLSLLYSLQRNDRRIKQLANKSGDIKEAEGKALFLNVLSDLNKLHQDIGLSSALSDDIAYLHFQVENYKVTLPIVGKFSAGKSSLLNTYLGEELLQWDINPKTAVATELLFSESPKVVLHYRDGKTETQAIDVLNSLPVSDDLLFVECFLNNVKLKHRQDIRIVDMPGFDSTLKAHYKAISTYISRGDIFINLFPADVPYDDSIMQYLYEITYNYDKEVHCLLSKTGRYTSTILQEKRAELQSLLELYIKPNQKGEINLGNLESKDKNRININDFEDILDEATVNYEKYIKLRFSDDIRHLLERATQELNTRLAFTNSGEAELMEMKENLDSDFQSAQKQIDYAVQGLTFNLKSTGKENIINKVTQTLNSSVDQLARAAQEHRLNDYLNEILRPILQIELTQLIESELSKLQQKLQKIDAISVNGITVSIQIPPEEKEKFSVSTSSICAGIGAVIFGPLGAAVAGILGGVFGRKDNAEQREAQIRSEITGRVIPEVVSQIMLDVENQLTAQIRQLTEALKQTLVSQKESYVEELQKLNLELEEKKKQHQQLQESYSAHLQQLDAYQLVLC